MTIKSPDCRLKVIKFLFLHLLGAKSYNYLPEGLWMKRANRCQARALQTQRKNSTVLVVVCFTAIAVSEPRIYQFWDGAISLFSHGGQDGRRRCEGVEELKDRQCCRKTAWTKKSNGGSDSMQLLRDLVYCLCKVCAST